MKTLSFIMTLTKKLDLISLMLLKFKYFRCQILY